MPSEEPYSPSLDHVYFNGLDVVCLQSSNLEKRLKSNANSKKTFAAESIEAYADTIEMMSDVVHTYSRIEKRVDELTLNDNEFLRSY